MFDKQFRRRGNVNNNILQDGANTGKVDFKKALKAYESKLTKVCCICKKNPRTDDFYCDDCKKPIEE